MPQSSPRDDFFEADTSEVLPIVYISEGICIVGLAQRAIAQSLVLTLQRFLGQGLTICLTLPGPRPAPTYSLPVSRCILARNRR